MITYEKIEQIRDIIVRSIAPKKIILFGSYANGQASQDSDIDLLVVWNSDLSHHRRNVNICRLFPGRDFSLDVFAFSETEIESLVQVPGSIVQEAYANGRVIYG